MNEWVVYSSISYL